MMKLIKVDPSTSRNIRIEPADSCFRTGRVGNYPNTEYKQYRSGTKTESPIIFHNTRSNQITEDFQSNDKQSLSEVFNDKFRRVDDNTAGVNRNALHSSNRSNSFFKIKIDPKYKNLNVPSNKRAFGISNKKKRITFIPSSSKGSSVPIFISDNLRSAGYISKKPTTYSQISAYAHQACATFSRSLIRSTTRSDDSLHQESNESTKKRRGTNVTEVSNKRVFSSHIDGEMNRHLIPLNQIQSKSNDINEQDSLSCSASSIGKFSSDTKVKLHRNKLRAGADFSTGTFRVKIKAKKR